MYDEWLIIFSFQKGLVFPLFEFFFLFLLLYLYQYYVVVPSWGDRREVDFFRRWVLWAHLLVAFDFCPVRRTTSPLFQSGEILYLFVSMEISRFLNLIFQSVWFVQYFIELFQEIEIIIEKIPRDVKNKSIQLNWKNLIGCNSCSVILYWYEMEYQTIYVSPKSICATSWLTGGSMRYRK